MAKLILSMDGLVLKEISLSAERMTIGRRPSNDIIIDNLAISGEHAAIVTILNDSFLEDLGSTNGTVVNGQPIKKHFLQANDVIEMGKYKLKYIVEPKKVANYEKPIVSRAGGATTDPDDVAPALVTSSSDAAASGASALSQSAELSGVQPVSGKDAGDRACVQILNGPNQGRELALTKTLTTLGRPGVQVAAITRRSDGYFFAHVEGPEHPRVNGEMLGELAHALNDHDVIELAGTRMEFLYK